LILDMHILFPLRKDFAGKTSWRLRKTASRDFVLGLKMASLEAKAAWASCPLAFSVVVYF
jgi:hypothetical protein